VCALQLLSRSDIELTRRLDVVNGLMRHLGVEHISVMGHSSGAVYVLNTLLHLRDILQPSQPYVALVTPWVHPSHSEARSSNIANLLPDIMIRGYYTAIDHITCPGKPMLGPATAHPGMKMKNTSELTRAIDEKVMEYALLEDAEGISQEALFCLRRGPEDLWGP
jgi:hypothetical protein